MVNNIHLVLYGDLHVQQALTMVAANEVYSEVLCLGYEPREEDEQPPVLQAATPNPVLDAAIMKTKGQHIEGDAPPQFPEQASYRDGVLTDQEVQDYNCPGPFSFNSYLMALLSPNMWGDEQVLCLCSMLWQIGLMVVSAEQFTQIKFRHKSTLEQTGGVLVMCLGQHYIPAHKYSSFVPLYLSLLIVIAPGRI